MDQKRSKKWLLVLCLLFLISVIPATILIDREAVADLEFPLEAIVEASPALSIRPDPSTKNPPLGTIPHKSQVLLLEQIEGEAINDNKTWYRVDYNNRDGFVSAEFIEIKNWEVVLPDEPNDQSFEEYLDAQGFPESYRPALRELHKQYPEWIFTGLKLNLSFESALNGQHIPTRSINFVQAHMDAALKSTSSADFNSATNEWYHKEPGWVAASRGIIAHQLDPRNFLDEVKIFQFENLSYNPEVHLREFVRNLVRNSFLDSEDYTDYFMRSAEHSGVSPYHLVSRVIQENGASGSASSQGNYPGLEGYYNLFNVQAYGSDPVKQGLEFARDGWGKNYPEANAALFLPWNSPERSIMGGGVFLGRDYINKLQNTLYLQKFDLRHSPPYWHQYMTNVFAPESESYNVHRGYAANGQLAGRKEFLIPIFASMPEFAAPYPTGGDGTPNNWLRSITVGGELLPGFNRTKYQYQLTLKAPSSTIRVGALPYNQYARVEGVGLYQLKSGQNSIRLKVTATNGEVRFYEIKVDYQGDGSSEEVAVVTSDVYQILSSGSIYGLNPAEGLNQVEAVLKNIKAPEGHQLTVEDLNGETVSEGFIATGFQLVQKKGDQVVGRYPLILLGDVNQDGRINIVDAEYIFRYIVKRLELNNIQLLAANTQQDERVNIIDAEIIFRHIIRKLVISQTIE